MFLPLFSYLAWISVCSRLVEAGGLKTGYNSETIKV